MPNVTVGDLERLDSYQAGGAYYVDVTKAPYNAGDLLYCTASRWLISTGG